MFLSYSLCAFLFLSRTHRRSRSLDQNKRSNWTSLEREAKDRQEGEERKRRNESRGKEEPSVTGGTKREVKDGVKEEGGGGRSKRKRKSNARSNKSSRDAVQSEQTKREGPEGEKDEEIGPSGRCRREWGSARRRGEDGWKEEMAGM